MNPVSVRLACILFLNVGRIGQHQRAQLLGARRAEDPAPKASGHQPRQVAAVIEMRVRQHDAVDGRGVERQRLPVAQPQLF